MVGLPVGAVMDGGSPRRPLVSLWVGMIMRSEGGAEASERFYAGLLAILNESKVPYLVGGTCAVNEYIGLGRPTKDLDIFCRASDFPRVLGAASKGGYDVQVEDERWIAKITRDEHFCDVVFGSANMVAPVTEEWFTEKHPREIYGLPVLLLPPTELVWSKIFIMDRYKFDGNDVAHIMLRKHDLIDWKRLMAHADQHWEVLLLHILRFRYIYPVERALVPEWVLDELLARVQRQKSMPPVQKKVCRGRIFSREDFIIDIAEWGYADLIGDVGEMLPRPNGNEPGGEGAAEGCASGIPEDREAARRREAEAGAAGRSAGRNLNKGRRK